MQAIQAPPPPEQAPSQARLQGAVLSAPAQGKRILVTGVFDLFHVGHLRYLQYARQQGARLTVGVAPDALCLASKGKQPVIDESQRLEMVQGLGCVDEARYMPGSLELTPEAAAWISAWGIDLVVTGAEWQGSPRWQRLSAALAERGIGVIFALHTPGISSTVIVQRIQQRAQAAL